MREPAGTDEQCDAAGIDRVIDIARGAVLLGPTDPESRETLRLPYDDSVAWVELTRRGEANPPRILAAQSISTGGLAVRTAGQLPVGSRGAVLLHRSDGEAVVLPASVFYCTHDGPDGFVCGLDFEPPPAAVTVDAFHADPPLPDAARAA